MQRSESLLRQLLQTLGFNLPIYAHVVFVNPEFTLYQSPRNKPFIFPTQITRYLKNLNATQSKLTKKHQMLATNLASLHMTDSPFTLLPAYEYEQLRTGITCAKCTSFSLSLKGKYCICHDCGYGEVVATSVIRSVEEFKLLFPTRRITTNAIYDWCQLISSKRKIRTILEKNFKKVGVRQWTYYE
ncbi:hypothetical protein JCM9157_1034 [Halalkalibacter akibai JCM 9157]|uniref:NERD domain-containing protein n=1 Tax=Halalkalibacter akibai (strain ATCC 43226 / DSM 21942 / CIP 109018 / JCM 9157 / 1139) TaxID=1236973 RepID=W4QRR5_HALA3|nr:hypothetical protein JCM9157_1034 [Halalkalibacter akibai JCM 9157]